MPGRTQARLADLDRLRMDAEEARRLVKSTVATAAALGEVLRAALPAERKAIVRSIVEEIAIDPQVSRKIRCRERLSA